MPASVSSSGETSIPSRRSSIDWRAVPSTTQSAPLLVRAAKREPVERTPVWFMRQAGRTLPGYRAIRKRHDLFEVCRRPELCAQVTLEPVEAHGVDAAVMFADIMLPVIGMGVDVQLVENVGPVIDRPIESLDDVRALRVPEPEDAVPFVLEAVRIVRESLVGGPRARRLLRRPVHRRGLSDRGEADAGVREDEGLHVRHARGLARADGAPQRDLPPLRPGQGRGGRRRDPALRQLGRRAHCRGLRGVRRALLGADPRRALAFRRSTSGPAPRTYSSRWLQPAAT